MEVDYSTNTVAVNSVDVYILYTLAPMAPMVPMRYGRTLAPWLAVTLINPSLLTKTSQP
ncbi:Protein of unknown function [Pyronema omphalodes CBS 100304]|uniref:Uncharacterized protein n=1 Tax=Pyronema omphalodes (strain CBS 100304) TaxID=1076935 RepID=U4LMS4_PYROM|nr:Protein of unknown function [Pyronema omphalodes CBS 100304]